jgi:hypothetical protein
MSGTATAIISNIILYVLGNILKLKCRKGLFKTTVCSVIFEIDKDKGILFAIVDPWGSKLQL